MTEVSRFVVSLDHEARRHGVGPDAGGDDPLAAVVSPFDLGVTRGDGVFEAMLVRHGHAIGRRRHRRRWLASAAVMELDGPDDDAWDGLIDTSLARWRGSPRADDEAVLKIVMTRGDEIVPGRVSVFATIAPLDPALQRQRRDGVDAVTVCSGTSTASRQAAPWLLGGVKSLSYAVQQAIKRAAAARGADDAILVSTDGGALEGPSSSLVWREHGTLCTTPMSWGVLAGTTQAELFARCAEIGLESAERGRSIADVAASDGAWLCSSTRGVAAVRSIDGEPLRVDADLTRELHRLSGIPASDVDERIVATRSAVASR